MGVQFPPKALYQGPLAQLVEHLPLKEIVQGSSPWWLTRMKKIIQRIILSLPALILYLSFPKISNAYCFDVKKMQPCPGSKEAYQQYHTLYSIGSVLLPVSLLLFLPILIFRISCIRTKKLKKYGSRTTLFLLIDILLIIIAFTMKAFGFVF